MVLRHHLCLLAPALLVVGSWAVSSAAAQQALPRAGSGQFGAGHGTAADREQEREPKFPATYGPLDAAVDAQKRHEQRRLDEIDRQRQLNAAMRQTAGTGPDQYGYYPSDAYLYAYPGAVHADPRRGPARRAWRRDTRAYRRAAEAYRPVPGAYRYPYPGYPSVFTPWPLVPGDIWGYPYVDRVEQPLGHKKIVTGPNSNIYRPVYESDLKPEDAPPPAPAWRELLDEQRPAQPEAPAPPRADLPGAAPPPAAEPGHGGPEAVPAPPAEPGPREF